MRKFGLFLILSVLSIGIHAQELTEQEAQAKEDSVFNMKLSGLSHYAEAAVEMIMEDDAQVSVAEQQSMLLLQTHVINIFSKCLHMKNEDVQEIYELIEEKAYEVEIKRGDLLKVCTYIAKDAFKGWLGRKKVKPLTPEDSLILFGPKEQEILPPTTPEPPVVSPVDTTSNDVKTDDTKASIEEKKTEIVIKPEPVELSVKEVEVPALCQKLIDKDNFQSLMEFLEGEQFYNKLMYGSLNEMQYISKCYVVIVKRETQKIEAVLDKGESSRMNFISKQMDYYGNYPKDKYAIIFVQDFNK